MNHNHVFMIDSGHGGLIDGFYTTAPNKMHKFPDGTFSHEGVINRNFKNDLFHEMDLEGLSYIDLCPTNLDMGIDERVDIANRLLQQYPVSMAISIHNNASPKHNATGSEVWTTKGQTKSDPHASIYGECFQRIFPNIKFRPDTQDGDIDKESMFYFIKYTKCPAILIEILFFDYWMDFMKLTDPVFRYEWAAKVIITYMKLAIAERDIW